jgi:DNA-binding PadR family transcriptional regulator
MRMRHGFGPWGPVMRARRGDVPAAVLMLLSDRPMHGYQVIQELENRSGGAWRVSPGSVYPTLQFLEEEGLISGQEVEGRRVYSLTEAGRARVDAIRQAGQPAPWEEVAEEGDEPLGVLRRAAFQLAAAAMQVGQAGSKDQVDRAVAILDEARRKLYAILAEDTAS